MIICMTGFAGDVGSAKLVKENMELMKGRFSPSFLRRYEVLEANVPQLENLEFAVPTSSGVFQALWKLGELLGSGLEVKLADIPIKQESIEACEVMDVSPYEIPSSGFVFVMPDGEMPTVGTIIGRTRPDNDRVVITKTGTRFLEKVRLPFNQETL